MKLFDGHFHGPPPGIDSENLARALSLEIGHNQYDLFRPAVQPYFREYDRDIPERVQFRTRRHKAGAEKLLFDTLLTKLREKGLLKARGWQRTDSTHVLPAVRAMNRLERVVESMRRALNCLAIVVPKWLREHSSAEWVDRYGPRADDHRLPTTKAEREAYAEVV